MSIENFNSPMMQIIKSYLYQQYADDDDLQAFVDAFNNTAQNYLDWRNQTPLAIYTSPMIYEQLLDWILVGIYGIYRPIFGLINQSPPPAGGNTAPWNGFDIPTKINANGNTSAFTIVGPYETVTYNTRPFGYFSSVANSGGATTAPAYTVASDDTYKRLATWILYRGDGFQMSLNWLRRRVARFCYGLNGADIDIGLVSNISITITGDNILIKAPKSPSSQILIQLIQANQVPLPLGVNITMTTV
ncbi:hypothetical protein E0H77_12505 [Acinetobacter sp. ANC 4633]|uniref:hypothetical protein n=1 Tax=Acinetobacter sp. ANC 4633 TaxID=2529845 RepID=UPI00103C2806|nr:hypothetical protein [Acinetobacter sp. ANC 4633]TCB23937.1 hypothetical protein E0H77_12505 [Acinetobacter sp. ANC 4633]